MITYKLNGECHCKNIHFALVLSRSPETYNPRACDCDFCRKHGASYLSDPDGSLIIYVKNVCQFGQYRQGSEIAEFLLCKNCGVLLGITYRHEGAVFATINSNAVKAGTTFGENISVFTKTLTANEKAECWKANWFSNASIVTHDA